MALGPALDPCHWSHRFGNIGGVDRQQVAAGKEKRVPQLLKNQLNQTLGHFCQIPLGFREKSLPRSQGFITEKAGARQTSDRMSPLNQQQRGDKTLKITKARGRKGLTKMPQIGYQSLREEVIHKNLHFWRIGALITSSLSVFNAKDTDLPFC